MARPASSQVQAGGGGAGRLISCAARISAFRSPAATNVARSSQDLAQRRDLAGDDRRAAGQRLDGRQAKTLVLGGKHERVGAGVDRGEVLVGDVPGERHVGQLVRPRARGTDEHERQLAGSGGELGDVLARVGMLQAADPNQIALGQREARTCSGDLRGRARVHHRVGRLGDHDDALRLQPEALDGVAGHRLGGHDHPHRALHGQLAQTQTYTHPQVLAAALERREVVQRDDHRAWAAQHRALHPRCVEDIGGAPRAVGLLDLGLAAGRVAQGVEQAA